MTDTYTIRRGGCTVAESQIRNLGYDTATLRTMSAAGYVLYCNGKRVKLGR